MGSSGVGLPAGILLASFDVNFDECYGVWGVNRQSRMKMSRKESHCWETLFYEVLGEECGFVQKPLRVLSKIDLVYNCKLAATNEGMISEL